MSMFTMKQVTPNWLVVFDRFFYIHLLISLFSQTTVYPASAKGIFILIFPPLFIPVYSSVLCLSLLRTFLKNATSGRGLWIHPYENAFLHNQPNFIKSDHSSHCTSMLYLCDVTSLHIEFEAVTLPKERCILCFMHHH